MTKAAQSAYHRYPREVISTAAWLYHRFSLSFRDVEKLMAHRGVVVSYESIRRWCLKFGPKFQRNLKLREGKGASQWHVDEVFLRINGEFVYLWRAVDQDGDVMSLTSSEVTQPLFATYCQAQNTTLDVTRITEPRIHTSQREDGSDKCSDSNRPIRPNDSGRYMPGVAICSVMVAACCRPLITACCVTGRFRYGRWLRTSNDYVARVFCEYSG